MSAHRHHRSTWPIALALTGLTLSVTAIVFMTTAPESRPAGHLSIPGTRQLTDAEMRTVTGGWLEPKARRPSPGGCNVAGCPQEGSCRACEDYVSSDPFAAGFSTGEAADGGAPCVDGTTAEVYDSLEILEAGPAGGGLTVQATYASHLADGTNTIVDSALGTGWTHSYNSFLWQRGANFYWFRCNTEIVRFTYRAGRYQASTGQFYTLTQTGPQTAEVQLKDGTIYQFVAMTTPWQPSDALVFVLDGIVDPNGRTTTLTYDGFGRLVQVTDPDQNAVEYEYTADGRLQRVTAAGREAQFEYGPTGQLSTATLPNAERIEYEYNEYGQLVRKGAPRGEEYQLEYNSEGKVIKLEYRGPDDPTWHSVIEQSSTSNWEPDHAQSLITGEMHYHPGTSTVTDGRGSVWEYEYDSRGRVVWTRMPDGTTTSTEYDPATLRPSRATDANGNITEYEYDERGNRTLVRDAEGNETQYEYEPNHNRLVRQTEPDGDEWIYEYDANGNLVREIDPLHGSGGPTIEYEHDSEGRLIHKTDRNGNETEWEYDVFGNVHKATDPIGVETTYEYDYYGNVLSRTLHADDPNTPASEDQTTTYTYDARNRVVTQTDALGVTTRYEYDADGDRVATYSDWIGDTQYRSVTRYEYDERGRVTRMIEDEGPDNLNRTTEYEYDENGNLIREVNPNGVPTEYEYDPLNRLIRTVVEPGGLAITSYYSYDPAGNRVSATDANGHTTTYEHDSLNRLIFMTDALGYVNEYCYFPPGGGCCGTPGSSLVKCLIDAAGHVTQYQYDKLDRRTHEIRQVGVQDCDRDPLAEDAVTEYTYDANGNALAITDANGNTTTSTYTARDELATAANGCGETVSYTYDPMGDRISEVLPNGNVIWFEYDLNNRPVRTYDALGDIETYTYDAVGNLLTQADPVGPPTTSTYDHLDRQTTTTDPMGETTQYEYDSVGNLLRIVDREGNQTVYQYDAADRLTAWLYWPDANGSPSVIARMYDPVGNLVQITDANGNATSYEYDANNRKITETFADETEKRFAYDAVGNLATREDNMGEGDTPGTGNITIYTYDDLNRLISRDYANAEVDQFTYDQGGRMLAADNNHSHLGFTYDAADRIVSSTQTDLPQTYSYVTGIAYDVYANTRTLTYPSGKIVVETRDLRDRLWTVTLDGDPIAEYAYDLANRTLTKTFGNGTQARYEYNDNDWVTSLRHVLPDGVTTFAGFTHDYDKEGNRLSAVNLEETIPYDPAKPVTHSEKYVYDDMYRLVDYKRGEWVGGDIPAPRRHRDWLLDPVHNWTQFGIHDLDTGEDAEYCNSINQMNEYDDPSTDGPCPGPDDDGLADDFMVSPCPALAVPVTVAKAAALKLGRRTGGVPQDARHGGLPSRSTGYNWRHDKNGNLVDDGTREFYYDYQTDPASCLRSENRLTMVKDKTTGNILGEYWYDALGRRIQKLVPGTPGVSTVYVLTPQWREGEEYEAQGAGALDLARSYTFGHGIDRVLTIDRAPEADRFHSHGNAIGSIMILTDGIGTPVERYGYGAYGAPTFFDAAGIRIPQSETGNPYLFAGRRFDSETSLYQCRTRYLSPETGRFTGRDGTGTWGDPSNLGNAYTYGRSNPLRWRDPFGLSASDEGQKLRKQIQTLRRRIAETNAALGKKKAELERQKRKLRFHARQAERAKSQTQALRAHLEARLLHLTAGHASASQLAAAMGGGGSIHTPSRHQGYYGPAQPYAPGVELMDVEAMLDATDPWHTERLEREQQEWEWKMEGVIAALEQEIRDLEAALKRLEEDLEVALSKEQCQPKGEQECRPKGEQEYRRESQQPYRCAAWYAAMKHHLTKEERQNWETYLQAVGRLQSGR